MVFRSHHCLNNKTPKPSTISMLENEINGSPHCPPTELDYNPSENSPRGSSCTVIESHLQSLVTS